MCADLEKYVSCKLFIRIAHNIQQQLGNFSDLEQTVSLRRACSQWFAQEICLRLISDECGKVVLEL